MIYLAYDTQSEMFMYYHVTMDGHDELVCSTIFVPGGDWPMVNIDEEDLRGIWRCMTATAYNDTHAIQRLPLSSRRHIMLYDYLVKLELEHIRFIPLTEDGWLDYRYSFSLHEWAY